MRDRLIRASKWTKHHTWPKMRGLRHFIFHAKTNGLDEAIKKIEGKVFINEYKFHEWASKYESVP